MPDAADPVQEIAELRVLLAEREAELADARAELTGARRRIEQYKAQLPSCGACSSGVHRKGWRRKNSILRSRNSS